MSISQKEENCIGVKQGSEAAFTPDFTVMYSSADRRKKICAHMGNPDINMIKALHNPHYFEIISMLRKRDAGRSAGGPG